MQAYVVGYGSLIDGEMVFEGVSSIAFDEDKANELAEGVSDVWGGSGTFGCVLGPFSVFGDKIAELENEIAGLRERLNVSKEVINTQSWQVEYMRAQLDEAPRE